MVDRLIAAGGFARSAHIARTTSDRVRLAAVVADGDVVRVARGVVALPGAEPFGVALACGGALTCVSALAQAGLPLLRSPTRPHVAVPRARGVRRGVVQHFTQADPGHGLVATPLALVHAMRCLPFAEWVGVADAAVRQGVELSELSALRPYRRPYDFDRRLRFIDPLSDSLPESMVRVAMVTAGLHPTPQAWVPGVGRVDFLVDGVIVEVDGFAYHQGRREYREDRRRDRAAHAQGLVVLRFTFEDVVTRLDEVASEIVAMVRRHRTRQL